MSPRKRNPDNAGFPTGWRWRGKRLYYMVPAGQRQHWDNKTEFPLGPTIAGAYKIWAERLAVIDQRHIVTFDQLCDQYIERHVTTLSVTTQESYTLAVRRIRAVFGHTLVADLNQQLTREFYNALRREFTPATAKSTIGVLKAMMSKAADWGAVPANITLGMRFQGAGNRDRYLEHWEIRAMLSLQPSAYNSRGTELLLPYIKIKLMTGLRRGDLLRLRLSDIRDDGIHVQPHKTRHTTAKRMLFTWNDDLRAAVDQARRLPPARIGDATLFVTRRSDPYINADGKCPGFNSTWRRFVDRVLTETTVTDRFQEKDIRAKAGSDAASTTHAQELLGHASPAVTDKHYRRAEKVIDTPGLQLIMIS